MRTLGLGQLIMVLVAGTCAAQSVVRTTEETTFSQPDENSFDFGQEEEINVYSAGDHGAWVQVRSTPGPSPHVDPKHREALEKISKQQQDLIREYRTNPENREKTKSSLKAILKKEFSLRQTMQANTAKKLQERLERVQDVIKTRNAHSELIIDSRLAQLLGGMSPLSWDASAGQKRTDRAISIVAPTAPPAAGAVLRSAPRRPTYNVPQNSGNEGSLTWYAGPSPRQGDAEATPHAMLQMQTDIHQVLKEMVSAKQELLRMQRELDEKAENAPETSAAMKEKLAAKEKQLSQVVKSREAIGDQIELMVEQAQLGVEAARKERQRILEANKKVRGSFADVDVELSDLKLRQAILKAKQGKRLLDSIREHADSPGRSATSWGPVTSDGDSQSP